MSSRVPHYEHTRVAVELHSHDQVLRIGPGANSNGGRIVSCKIDKGFGPAAGNFSITLKRIAGQRSFLELFGEGEGIWIRIQWVINGRRYDRLWGITDTIVEDVMRDDEGRRVEVVSITGRDFGKVAEQTTLFINIHERDGILPVAPLYTAIQERLIGRPDEIIKTLIDGWLGNNGAGDKQWILPPSLSGTTGRVYFWDWLNTRTMSPNLRGTIFSPTLLAVDGAGRNLWDSMQEYSNGVLNEMWFDLAPDPDLANGENRPDALRPSLIMRERPFPTRVSSARWTALPAKRLHVTDVKKRNVVLDGAGRFNYWSLYAVNNSASNFSASLIQQQGGRPPGQPGNVPIYDLDSIRKFGLRRFEQQTRYLPIDDKSETARTYAGTAGNTADFWIRIAVQWLRIIHDWYVTAPQQFTGTIELAHSRPDIRLGDRIIEERRDGSEWEYYVEHIADSYDYGSDGRMTLTVTRGQPVGVDYLAAQYRRYTGVDAATLTDDDLTSSSITPEETADEIGAPPPDLGSVTDDITSSLEETVQNAVASVIASEPDPEEQRDLTDADFEDGEIISIYDEPLVIEGDPNAAPLDEAQISSMEMGEVAVNPRRPLGARGRPGRGRGRGGA